MRASESILAVDDVAAAAERLSGIAHRTPMVSSRTLNERVGAEVHLKCENLQRTGAFKFRGAYNAIAQLAPEQLRRGVVTFSSGNHAQAVALAAKLLGSSAVVVMPADSPPIKTAAVRGYGAEIVTFDRYADDRLAIATGLAAERGLTFIHPFEDRSVMAGQGTTAIEMLEDTASLDALLVPLGGGALLAGCATAAKAMRPGIHIVGVETAAGDKTRRSLEAGARVRIPVPVTIADGVTGEIPGELTFEISRRLVDEVVVVEDDHLLEAMIFLFDRMKLVTEPSGVLGVAALLSRRVELPGRRVGVVVSGGNVGFRRFCALVDQVAG